MEALTDLPATEIKHLLKDMLRVRRFEEMVIDLWAEVETEGHRHVYVGQEAVGAAICAELRADDLLVTTHRNHGHVLLRGASPGEMLAEVLGRADGINGGRGGSAGMSPAHLGFLLNTAQVGGGVGLGMGGGFAQRIKGRGGISVAFFGDGSLEEGIAFESLNLAALERLPVLFVCENNSVGVSTGRAQNEWSSSSMAATTLGDVPKALQITTEVVAGEDVLAVRAAAQRLISALRTGTGPAFIEARSHRWPGSRSFNPQMPAGPTDLTWAGQPDTIPEEHREWIDRYDPIVLLARRLLAAGHVDAAELAAMDAAVADEMAEAKEFALASPLPDASDVLQAAFAPEEASP